MSTHTPTPWHIGGNAGTADRHPEWTIESQFGQVATVMAENCDDDEQVKADAELIVRAVNAHKALVLALEAFLAMPYPTVGQEMSYRHAQDIQVHRNIAREALELAKFGRTDGR